MFHEVPEGEPPPHVRTLMERTSAEFCEALHAIGVYIDNVMIVGDSDAEPPVAVAVLTGRVGDVAFSDRVLRPQAVSDEDILDEIADATVADEYQRNRRRLLGLDE